MSYLHCPSCARAYNLAHTSACPHCARVPGALARTPTPARPSATLAAPVDPVAEIVVAATQLARALARATPAQRTAARASLGLIRRRITTAIDPMSADAPRIAAGWVQLARLPRLLGAAAAVLLPGVLGP